MNLATERIISHLNELHDVTKLYLLGQSFFGIYAVISHNEQLLHFAVAWSLGHCVLGWVISKTSAQFKELIDVIRRAEQLDFDSETAAILYSREQVFNQDAKQILSLGSTTDNQEAIAPELVESQEAAKQPTFTLSKRVEGLEELEVAEVVKLADFIRTSTASDSYIIENVLHCKGRSYQKGKQLLEQIKAIL
ncbi:MAG: hypothetical protein F6K25_29870 [Okeania sp. SIO2G4]|uniref:hypothetical protein n=1 Tax=unclassified Okeania TaxID=2634635 RepID=UPI0013B66D35|nr:MULTISPECIES: hypothetical protein [unclassified Okeania]NEP03571.1 hypothetical protein [Okeania sp. SIO4D6]NEP38013.1 hypothetical protein [Okeania sp. SIO2H7]NEP75810.1 hypothetical protein [Okeania sp. SIO2G5]NEP96979.1 hypothetical protein [Okeania sp. SIO2F5]NEQ94620.1 hypothetical protein [Okeania sp. SIO2G4]